MFSSLLGTGGDRQPRSKSPSARRQDSDSDDEPAPRRKTSRSKYSETESDEEYAPEAPRYEERTPQAAAARPSKDDGRRPKKADEEDIYRQRPSAKYVDEDPRGRRDRDPYGFAETPRSARPNGYTNGNSYASYTGNDDVPGAFPGQASNRQYADPGKFQYARPDPSAVQYKYNDSNRQPSFSKAYDSVNTQPARPSRTPSAAQRQSYFDDRYERPELTRTNPNREEESPEPVRERRQSYQRERSPNPSARRDRSPNPSGMNAEQLRKNLGRLSTSSVTGATLTAGTPHTAGAGGRPPPSPLLEAYKGTYQTISPIPSPRDLVARKRDDDLSDFELSESGESDDEITQQIRALERKKRNLKNRDTADIISPRSSGSKLEAPTRKSRVSSVSSTTGSKSYKKSVSFYNPAPDAERMAEGLKGNHRTPDVKPLLKILPWLTTDEIIALKAEYKNHAKINGQGINLSKHIKARIPGNLGKVLYATSLGQYESDAYWANCFYQSGASRRELLIESLVGRSNQQIREIKDAFKDKRYDDDLEKCMKAELKADKFRVAILLALEERRQAEGLGIDMRKVHEDGQELHYALTNPGGETAMIRIIMRRSDDHLREVMRYYESSYRRHFARDMLAKSQNLVGETLAHILNGALNRPMRDAILLHQAIDEFAPETRTAHSRTPTPLQQKPIAGRAELLISRVVRLHWEPKHMERVKRVYQERYGESVVRALARDVQGGMKTEDGKAWAGFVIDLVRSSEE